MKIKTAELTGPALDWAVAIAKGVPPQDIQLPRKGDHPGSKRIYRRLRDQDGNLTGGFMSGPEFLFSSKWEAGGPLIDLAKLTVRPVYHPERTEHGSDIYRQDGWAAHVEPAAFWITPRPVQGPTPLIAICRCYVAQLAGDEVDVPEELL